MRRALAVAAVLSMLAGIVLGATRVVALETDELEHHAGPVVLHPRGGARQLLTAVRLDRGETISIEVCSPDGFPAERWRGAVAFDVYYSEAGEQVVSTALDDERLAIVRRGPAGGCLAVAEGRDLPLAGRFTVEAVYPEPPRQLDQAEVFVRAIAYRPFGPIDPWAVYLALGGALLLVLGLLWPARPPDPLAAELATEPAPPPAPSADATPFRGGPWPALGIGLALFATGHVAVAFIPVGGATGGLLRGALLAAIQIGAAVGLARRPIEALGLEGGRRVLLWLFPAVVAGAVVRIAGARLADLVPSTGESPIEALVFWPSGTLAVAVVAVLVPIAEELFFRGLVYGTVERRLGANAALAFTTLLFAAAHVPQTWGAWGALASVTLTGLVLTALRRFAGSTLAPVVAHLTHNAIISLFAVTAG